ncbi:NUDIX hydrolase, partial [Streptomyces rubiginosohelvolus]
RGVHYRDILAADAGGGVDHNIFAVFYRPYKTGGRLRPEPTGEITESVWTALSDVSRLRRSSLVDVGLSLAQVLPATGHVGPVPVGGLIQH